MDDQDRREGAGQVPPVPAEEEETTQPTGRLPEAAGEVDVPALRVEDLLAAAEYVTDEVMPVEVVLIGDEEADDTGLGAIDLAEVDPDEYAEEIARYTDDESVLEDFEQRQEFNFGSDDLLRRLLQYQTPAKSPDVTSEDVDAAWYYADTGDETPGGTAPTPDQDIVDEIGGAVGITYADDEPLGTVDKVDERDRHRWELDPESAEERDEELAGDESEWAEEKDEGEEGDRDIRIGI